MRALLLLIAAASALVAVPTATALGDADLEAGLTIVGTNIAPGQSAYYNATITNRGPGEARNARLSFTIPKNTELRWAKPSTGSCTGERTITCSFGLLHAGYSAAVDIGVKALAPGAFVSDLGVESDTSDPDSVNSHTRVTGQVRDLTAELSAAVDGPAAAILGETVEYTVTVQNAGPDRSRDTSLRNELGGPATLVSMTPSQGSCGDLKCSLGKLDAGDKATVKIVVEPTAAGEVSETAIVSGIDVDTDAGNQATAYRTKVRVRSIDLAVTPRGAVPAGNVGSSLAYSFAIANLGPDTATGVVATIPLPSGSGIVGAAASQGGCAVLGENLGCSLGSLASGATATVTVTIRAGAAGPLTLSAAASGNEPDVSSANQKADVTATVTAPPAQKKKAAPKKKGH